MKVFGYGLMAIAGVAATGVAYLGFSSLCTSSGAHNAVKSAVLDSLKSPSSAVFGSAPVIESPTNCLYKISGVVDSQNSFGAMTRTKYSGSVIDREYRVISLSIGE